MTRFPDPPPTPPAGDEPTHTHIIRTPASAIVDIRVFWLDGLLFAYLRRLIKSGRWSALRGTCAASIVPVFLESVNAGEHQVTRELVAWPLTSTQIEQRTGEPRSNVYRGLRALIAAGVIERVETGGGRAGSRYRLLPPPEEDAPAFYGASSRATPGAPRAPWEARLARRRRRATRATPGAPGAPGVGRYSTDGVPTLFPTATDTTGAAAPPAVGAVERRLRAKGISARRAAALAALPHVTISEVDRLARALPKDAGAGLLVYWIENPDDAPAAPEPREPVASSPQLADAQRLRLIRKLHDRDELAELVAECACAAGTLGPAGLAQWAPVDGLDGVELVDVLISHPHLADQVIRRKAEAAQAAAVGQ